MSKLIIPGSYQPILSVYETQRAIGDIKRIFEQKLSSALNLMRVSAPLFVESGSGLNDDLNGIERPVEFDLLETGSYAQIVQSLAKWKRIALHKYGIPVGEGLYTDMNAVRRDEEMDNLHSIYVDQWDWEKVIDRTERNIEYLKETVEKIVGAICDTEEEIGKRYLDGKAAARLCRVVSFVTSQELEDMYPELSPKERENEYVKKHRTAFIMQIGGLLRSGIRHDGRAPDYDDWTLNGDILFWNELLECAFEISSMGIRVDEKALDGQLTMAGCDNRRNLPYHKQLLGGGLPLAIGGGIGQSRLCMLFLKKAHIGEVQSSIWDKDTLSGCESTGIKLL
ncbi:MAG: aspartate--ammonia ligase [Treponema sp.]|nr:aspartate--ammonia ligase [Treponema sp.]